MGLLRVKQGKNINWALTIKSIDSFKSLTRILFWQNVGMRRHVDETGEKELMKQEMYSWQLNDRQKFKFFWMKNARIA